MSLFSTKTYLATFVLVLLLARPQSLESIPVSTRFIEIAEAAPAPSWEESLDAIIDFYALKYSVPASTIKSLLICEAGADLDPKVQSNFRYELDHPEWGVKAGDRELSFGLAQIHLPSHPDISKEEAENPHFAVDFVARSLSEGNGHMWSCYEGVEKV